MPDFPRGAGATAAEVWAYSARTMTALTGQPRTDLMGEDASFEAGTGTRKTRIDATISSRSSHSAADVWAVSARTITALTGQPRTDLMGEDASFEAGTGTRKTRIDTTISSRSSHTAADIWAVSTRALTGITGTPRSDLLGEDATFEAGTGARKARIDATPAFVAPTEASITMDGTEKVLFEITDVKSSEIEAWVDLTTMASGDEIAVKYYRKMKAAGSYVQYASETYTGVQSPPALCILSKKIYRDTKVTATQTATPWRTLDVQVIRAKEA